MMTRYAQTDLAVYFEAAGRSEEAKGGRAKGILRRQDDATVVDAAGIRRGSWRTSYSEVPLKEVGFLGFGMVI
jgi:hypothetical protein